MGFCPSSNCSDDVCYEIFGNSCSAAWVLNNWQTTASYKNFYRRNHWNSRSRRYAMALWSGWTPGWPHSADIAWSPGRKILDNGCCLERWGRCPFAESPASPWPSSTSWGCGRPVGLPCSAVIRYRLGESPHRSRWKNRICRRPWCSEGLKNRLDGCCSGTGPPWNMGIQPLLGHRKFFLTKPSCFRTRLMVRSEGIGSAALWSSHLMADTPIWAKDWRCNRCLIEMILCRSTSLIWVGLLRGALDLERYQSGSPDWYRFSHLKNHCFVLPRSS